MAGQNLLAKMMKSALNTFLRGVLGSPSGKRKTRKKSVDIRKLLK